MKANGYSIQATMLPRLKPIFRMDGDPAQFIEGKTCINTCVQTHATEKDNRIVHVIYPFYESSEKQILHESIFDKSAVGQNGLAERVEKLYEEINTKITEVKAGTFKSALYDQLNEELERKWVKVTLIADPGYTFKKKAGSKGLEGGKNFKGVTTSFSYEPGATLYNANGTMQTANVISFEATIGRSMWAITNPEDKGLLIDLLQQADKWLNQSGAVYELITIEESKARIKPFNPSAPIKIDAFGSNVEFINGPITPTAIAPKPSVDVSGMDLDQLESIIKEFKLPVTIGRSDTTEIAREKVRSAFALKA